MSDNLTPEQRRRAMAANHGRTRVEIRLASALWHAGFRYVTAAGYARGAGRRLAGSPDLVFARWRLLVFVDGCFWHGCRSCGRRPIDGAWSRKLERNRARDELVDESLAADGWRVIRVAEHALHPRRIDRTVRIVTAAAADAKKGLSARNRLPT